MHRTHVQESGSSSGLASPSGRAAWRGRATLSLALGLVVGLCTACTERPPEIPSLDPQAATELVRAEFPEAGVVVSAVEVSGVEATGTIESTIDAPGMVPIFGYDEAWSLTHVVLDGERFTVSDLRAIVATRDALVRFYDGLVRYHADRGEYPAGEDASGLETLIPGHVAADVGLLDGWGNPFAYRPQDGEFTLSSAGIDGILGSPDDLILLSTGG